MLVPCLNNQGYVYNSIFKTTNCFYISLCPSVGFILLPLMDGGSMRDPFFNNQGYVYNSIFETTRLFLYFTVTVCR